MAYTTINKSSEYFNTHLYSGNETTNNQQVGLTPDLVWVKCRNVGSPTQHFIVDKVRGDRKYISSNATTAEQTDGATFDLVSGGFNLDGGNGWTNLIGRNYVAWNWKANGSGVSNTDGSITSTVSANTTSGFSIVKWTGTSANATVGHGLNSAPKMILFKDTTNAGTNWGVYHKSIGAGYRLTLNDTTASAGPDSTFYQNTDPSSSLIYLGSNSRANASSAVIIAYCFAEKKGFSKFGSYTGNGSTDGTFVYTGFKPSFVLIKRTSTTGNWFMFDNKRNTYNPVNTRLTAEGTYADDTGSSYAIDFVSNGFKLRTNSNPNDGIGEAYIYMAFAEEPLVGTNNIPACAR